jgi:hypothetical protein
MKARQQIKQTHRELDKRWRRIDHGGSLDQVRQSILAAIAWSEVTIELVNDKIGQTAAEFARLRELWFGVPRSEEAIPWPDYYQTRAHTLMYVGAWALVCVEAWLAALMSIKFFNVEMLAAALIGITATILLTYGAKGLIGLTFLAHWSEQPKGGFHSIKRALAVLGVIEAILLFVLFLLRGSTGGSLAEFAWWMATSILSVLTPTIAALLFVATGFLAWSSEHHRDWEAWHALRREIQAFQGYCAKRPDDLDKTLPPAKAPAEKPPKAAAAALAALFILRPWQPCGSAAGQAPPAVPAVPAANCSDAAVQIWMDVSSSMSIEQRCNAAAYVDRQLDDMIRLGIKRWEFFSFYEDAWTTQPFHATFVSTFKDPPCEPVDLTELERILKRAAEKTKREAEEHCNQAKQAAFESYRADLKRVMSDMHRALSDPPAKAGHCTSFYDLLGRLRDSAKPLRAIIVSDSLESCDAQLQRLDPPKGDVQVFLLLVSPKHLRNRTPGREFQIRKRQLHEFAPWVTVIAPWNFQASLVNVPGCKPEPNDKYASTGAAKSPMEKAN